ncbi:MAG: DUF3040 domain-containing protein [Candidatus Nanopelagicales bacterium]|nr:DUF3040 domain-containing protein [Candidatus Nanopelagicales bacterium]MDZ4249383.1 DUF3040 domain-containing protein [Candidatus Nanopelagicales bacterium]MDZ7577907.1 DUF3040 domain-containing protein [Candidatus Nanopelagicales bacterium]
MPLSEHERRLLDQMEKALYAEDPKFAENLRKTHRVQIDRLRTLLGVLGIVLGVGILLAGVATSWAVIGVLGFLAMIAGGFLIYGAVTSRQGVSNDVDSARPRTSSVAAHKGGHVGQGGFMDRMEERWRKRRDDRGEI